MMSYSVEIQEVGIEKVTGWDIVVKCPITKHNYQAPGMFIKRSTSTEEANRLKNDLITLIEYGLLNLK